MTRTYVMDAGFLQQGMKIYLCTCHNNKLLWDRIQGGVRLLPKAKGQLFMPRLETSMPDGMQSMLSRSTVHQFHKAFQKLTTTAKLHPFTQHCLACQPILDSGGHSEEDGLCQLHCVIYDSFQWLNSVG